MCTLKLRHCHAWESSWFSFGTIILALSSFIVPAGAPQAAALIALVAVVVVHGIVTHRRTDDLIAGEHRMRQLNSELIATKRVVERQNANLEREIRARTRELRETSVRLAERNLALIDLDRVRSELLSHASHELRTPLTSIRGAAQNLVDGVMGAMPPNQREYVGIILSESGRLIGVVNNLLSLARAEAGRVELDLTELDLRELVGDVVTSLAPRAAEAHVALHVEGQPVVLSADPEKLRRVVVNLVDNAIKYSGDADSVTINLGIAQNEATVAVVDRGLGIEPDEIPRLFERFYRAESATAKPGTGLGLPIARNLARLHGGDIRVRSEPGSGSAFTLTLPLQLRRAEAA